MVLLTLSTAHSESYESCLEVLRALVKRGLPTRLAPHHQPDTGHGGGDHGPWLDGPSPVGISFAAALDTPEATWASLASPETSD